MKLSHNSNNLGHVRKFIIAYMLSLFFPLFSISGEDKFTSLSLQAEALTEAHDYITASQIYTKLLPLSLPDWQKKRLLYNMGTIRLAQQNPIEALTFFQKINPTDLSLPRFGSNLLLNEGIAYLQYAQSLALDSNSSFDQQVVFIEQSLKAFDQAKQLECQAQKEEFSSICESSSLLNHWIETARSQLSQALQNKRQKWMKNATLETLASLLHQNMQKWIDFLKKYQYFPKSFFPYFQYQAESLIPLWKALQQKEFSLDQKKAFEKSLASYLSASQNLNEQNEFSAVKEWEQSIEALKPLIFQKYQNIQYARLSYEVLLLQDTLIVPSLKDLIKQFENLKVEEKQSDSLKQIQLFLKTSLEALQNGYSEKAQFFFIVGYSQFRSLFKTEASSPAAILQQVLDQANWNLQLSFLAEAIPKDKAAQAHAILRGQQRDILTQVAPFIPRVLKEQDARFHQTHDMNSRCQQTPWDQVIPLYDRGFRSAQNIDKQYQQRIFDFQAVIAGQVQTIKEWEQALSLILHPPQQGGGLATQQEWADTFRRIQEMYLEDQPQPKQATKELHSW